MLVGLLRAGEWVERVRLFAAVVLSLNLPDAPGVQTGACSSSPRDQLSPTISRS
jgi:hypothetical protein